MPRRSSSRHAEPEAELPRRTSRTPTEPEAESEQPRCLASRLPQGEPTAAAGQRRRERPRTSFHQVAQKLNSVEVTCRVPVEKCQPFPVHDPAELRDKTHLRDISATLVCFAGPVLPAFSRNVFEPPDSEGTRVQLRFGPDGFEMSDGRAQCVGIALVPSSHLDVLDDDPEAASDVSVHGAYPYWGIYFRFDAAQDAARFRQEVQRTSIEVVSWIHSVFETDSRDARGQEHIVEPRVEVVPGTGVGPSRREGRFLCGCYVIYSKIMDFSIEPIELQEARFCLRWMELRGPLDDMGGMVEVRFYNHHGVNAHLVDVSYWEEDVGEDALLSQSEQEVAVTVYGHVVLFREPLLEIGGKRTALCLTFRSEAEAHTIAGIATAATRRNDRLLQSVQQKLASGLTQRLSAPGGQAQPRVYVRDDRDLLLQKAKGRGLEDSEAKRRFGVFLDPQTIQKLLEQGSSS